MQVLKGLAELLLRSALKFATLSPDDAHQKNSYLLDSDLRILEKYYSTYIV